MGGFWFDNEGATGKVTLSWSGDDWIVTDPDVDETIICLPGSDVMPSDVTMRYEVRGTVSRRIYGTGGSSDRLYLRDAEIVNAEQVETPTAKGRTGQDGTGDGGRSRRERSKPRDRKISELRDIADDTIGDRTFTATQEENESAVGSAKRKAMNQGRDPAIDPKLQETDDDS